MQVAQRAAAAAADADRIANAAATKANLSHIQAQTAWRKATKAEDLHDIEHQLAKLEQWGRIPNHSDCRVLLPVLMLRPSVVVPCSEGRKYASKSRASRLQED